MNKSKKPKKQNKSTWFTGLIRLTKKHKSRFLFVICLFVICLFVYLFRDLPSPTKLNSPSLPASTSILDRNGKLLYEIYAEKNRTPIKLTDLPDYVKQATIASEDKNFYRHHGFDFGGIARAAYNIVFHQTLQGGSTITQQLVKNSLLTPQRTWKRKIRETVLTFLTEVIYSKDKILEMYLNQTPYGGTAWGIEAATQTYFGKHAQDLSLAEAALIIGLPASPTRFSPFGAHPELAKDRQKRVLEQMAAGGFITTEQKDAALNEKLNYAPPATMIKAPHFVLYVKELLVDKYGLKTVEQGGLKVTTTLDLDLQTFSQQAVASEVAKLNKLKISNGAALVTNPKTGEILSMVGSKNYFDQKIDGNVNLTLRPRQPGSSIKPLNYALAIEKKLITPATVLNDIPTCFNVAGQKLYCPDNYDHQFHGPTQVRFALGNSYNLPAVKVLALNGLENFISQATKMGITTFTDPARYGLSLTLGGGEVTMYDMAQAFSGFANLGIRQDLWAIKKVEDQNGTLLFEQQESEGPRVLSMETAYLINHILLDNNARQPMFGPTSYLVVKNHPEVSVKTGTTNDLRDNWTIGWNPEVMVAAWVGNNDNSSMSYVASGVTGASPIWNKIITFILKDKKENWPLKPDGIVGAQVCSTSGKMPASEGSCPTRYEFFINGTVPTETESLRQAVEIDKTTGRLSTDKTPPENRELQERSIITDPLGTRFCLDCPQAGGSPEEAVVIKMADIITHPISESTPSSSLTIPPLINP
jgi:penicillin-binding protein 1C